MDYAIGIALALFVAGFGFANAGVPVWWRVFCLAYDVTAAGAMIWLLRHRPTLGKEIWQTGT